MQEMIYICKACGNGYDEADKLELHLRKEHTKTDFIAYLKKQAVVEARSR